MEVDDIFQSATLKASDLKGEPRNVVIATVQRKQYDDGDKLFITFQHIKKGLVCNKTNANRIANVVGSKTIEDWIGREVVLVEELVDFKGDTVPAIRVQKPIPRGKATTAAKSTDKPPTATDLNDEIPW